MQNALIAEKDVSNKTMRDIYNIVFKYKQKVLIFFFTVMAVVLLGTIFAPNIYRSDTKLLIRLGRESVVLDPTAATGQIVSIQQKRETIINSELEILSSRELAGEIVDAFGPEAIINGRENKIDKNKLKSSHDVKSLEQREIRDKAARNFMENLDIEVIKNSNIISVSYDSKSPQLACDVLAKLIDVYLAKHISVNRTAGSYEFFNTQKDKLYEDLKETEKKIRDIKNRFNIGSLNEQRLILQERIGQLQREIETTETEYTVAESKMKALKETLSHMPEIIVKEEMTGGAMSASDEMRKKYNALLTKEKELLSTFNDSSIPVIETKNQIRAVKELLEKTEENLQIKRGLNDNQQKLKLDLANEEVLWISCRAKLNVLKTQLEKAREELKVINDTELQLVNLEREKEIQTANYRNYSESLEQTRIDNELEVDKISNIGITQKPTYPLKPYRPRVLINLLLGLFFGISGGLGLAFFCDYLDHTLKNPEEIEKKLQIYSLGFVPALFADGVSKKEKRLEVPVIFNAESRIMKACEICADRFLDLTKKELKKFRILSITSCHRNEGCSTVSAYFAASLADHGEGRVLLVDANLQNPIQHRIFGINTSQGLSDILIQGQGKTSFIHRSSYDNLDLLCAGGSETIGKKRLFESKTFTDLLNYWKNEYSYIVLDTPSVSAENHAVSLGNAADGIIMVISADETRLEVAHRAIERMTKSGSSIIGGILNKRRYYVPSWLYKTLT